MVVSNHEANQIGHRYPEAKTFSDAEDTLGRNTKYPLKKDIIQSINKGVIIKKRQNNGK
jgi:hypothetical protein